MTLYNIAARVDKSLPRLPGTLCLLRVSLIQRFPLSASYEHGSGYVWVCEKRLSHRAEPLQSTLECLSSRPSSASDPASSYASFWKGTKWWLEYLSLCHDYWSPRLGVRLLVSFWPSPHACRHLGSEQSNEWEIYLSLFILFLLTPVQNVVH